MEIREDPAGEPDEVMRNLSQRPSKEILFSKEFHMTLAALPTENESVLLRLVVPVSMYLAF
jgi:hypothetical protein